MVELAIETTGEKLNIIYIPEEHNYPDGLEKLKGLGCRMPSMAELRTIFEYVLNNPDAGIPHKGVIWSSDPVEKVGRNDQLVMTKSFYGGKYGGDIGMEQIHACVNLKAQLLLIGIKI
jgi:hypothetical protein